jgi:(p)ppGpp synthase/HD superfamily hydrolase
MRKTFDQVGEARIEKALVFATATHAAVAQKRKYTGEDYIVHPIAVAERVRALPNATPDMVTAALLHDTVEDTRKWVDENGNPIKEPTKHFKNGGRVVLIEGITLNLIKAEFGPRVAEIVDGMTEASMPWDGNRMQRKAIDRAHLSKMDGEIQSAKLCDIWHNVHNIAEFDPGFAQKYLAEKWADLGVMSKADPELLAEVRNFIQTFLNRNRASA